MKTITFVDQTTLSVGDASTATNIVIAVSAFADIDDIRGKFTAENVGTIKLDDTEYHNMVPTGLTVPEVKLGEIPTVVFGLRQKTETEIIMDRLDELEEATNEILMG